MSDERAPIVGIDLGTTYSLVSVLQAGRPVVIPNVLGDRMTPGGRSWARASGVLMGGEHRVPAQT
jgi:molecular chaperone DnaK (HSP70)